MQPWQSRVVEQKAALDAGLEKVRAFMAGEQYRELPGKLQNLMSAQELVMADYSHFLGEQIAGFEAEGTSVAETHA